MIDFISENIGTIIVGLILAVIIFIIIRKMVKDKHSGKSSCGCNCSGCANAGICHGQMKK
jgi:hypothetical protein